MKSTARLFAAVGIPQECLKESRDLFRRLKSVAGQKEIPIKWVPPENWHITLSFFGDVPVDKIDLYCVMLREIASQENPFHLKVRGLGAFDSKTEARVLWAGVSHTRELEKLNRHLCQEIERKWGSEGVILSSDVYTYLPHMTLGRLKNPKSLTRLMEPFARRNFFEFDVEELVLFESRRHNDTVQYIPLEKFNLKTC